MSPSLPVIEVVDEFYRYRSLIRKYCASGYEFVIGGMAQKESSWNPAASRREPGYYNKYIRNNEEWQKRLRDGNYSPWLACTSMGLLQVLWPTAVFVGYAQPPLKLFDPELNIQAACEYFNLQLKNHGERGLGWVLAAYNAGTPKLTRGGKFTNQYYVDKVLEYTRELEVLVRCQNRRMQNVD